jgi:hypothetical protein
MQFWSFKIECNNTYERQWYSPVLIHYTEDETSIDDGFKRSYFEGLKRGYLTMDPSQLHDPDVCVPYKNTTSNSTASRRDNKVPANLLRGA